MAGPNLELIKFGMYVFFPIVIMVYYGDPDWYRKYVIPDRPEFLRLNKMAPSPPRNKTELKEELDKFKRIRSEKKQRNIEKEQQKQNENQQTTTITTTIESKLV